MDMADAIFGSQLQSRINEKGRKVLREAEMRDAVSRVAHSPIYVVSTYDHIVGNAQELRRPASRTMHTLEYTYIRDPSSFAFTLICICLVLYS